MKRIYVPVYALAALCITATLTAQNNGQGPVGFSGFAWFDSQYDGITGRDQGRPRWISTLSVNPVIPLWKNPLSVSLKISTLESGSRQSFNRFGLRYGHNWFDLQLGDTYPQFSSLTVQGIVVRGASINLHPSAFRLKLFGGQTRKGVPGLAGLNAGYRQNLYGGLVGLGKEQGAVFANLCFLYGKENYDSLNSYKIEIQRPGESEKDTIEVNRPGENMVAGLNFGLNLFKKSLSLRGEVAAGGFARDARAAKRDEENVPAFFDPRLTSQYDVAYSAVGRYAKKNTGIDLSFRRIGPAFVSYGAPFQQNDREDLRLGFNQGFFQNRVFFTLNADRVRDNLPNLKYPALRMKSSAAETFSFTPGINLAFKNWPYLNCSYSEFRQTNDDTLAENRLDARTRMLNLGMGGGFSLWRWQHSLNGYFSWHRNDIAQPAIFHNNDLDALYFSLSGNHRLRTALAFNWSVSKNSNRGATLPRGDIWAYRAGITPRFFKDKLAPSLQLTLSQNRGPTLSRQKTSLGLHIRYRPAKTVELNLISDLIRYADAFLPDTDYEETLVRLTTSVRW